MRDFWRVLAVSFLITVVMGYCALMAVDLIIKIRTAFPN